MSQGTIQDEAELEGGLERVLDTFRTHFRAATPFAEDRALADELSIEARPACEALAFGVRVTRASDFNAHEFHEALAMFTLLGRRAGGLGATPTAALAIVPSIGAGFEAARKPLPAAVIDGLRSVCIEGFCAGREERCLHDAEIRLVRAQAIVRVEDGCFALLLGGLLEPDTLRDVIDGFGRALLNGNARAAVVDLARLEEPTPSRAAEVFAADATARMLGVRCIFASVSEAWLDAASQARIERGLLSIEPTFELALRGALAACDLQVASSSGWRGRVRAILGRRD